MKTEDLLKFAGLCGILIPVIAITSIGLAILYAPWFSWTINCLSDLGVSGISSILFNYGLIITGVLAIIFGIFLRNILPKTKLSLSGAIIFLLAAISLAGVGIFPETVGDIHLISSISFFVLVAIAILIVGIAIIKTSKNLAIFMIVLAFISPCTFFIPWPGMGCAIAETIAIIPVMIFTFIFGVRMIFNKRYEFLPSSNLLKKNK